jgi:AcrR family transcriptional regulator
MGHPKPYHHGNLREALLQSAIRLIAEVGPTAFTLREVARLASVSHNAPYRHFQDKNALLAAVATQGYGELTDVMLEAAGKETNVLDRLKHAGLAYVSFALRRPEHFTVMFDAPFSKQTHPEAADAAERAFSVLVSLVKDCQEKKQQLMSGDPLDLALFAWSMVHGIAKLAITGRLPYRSKAEILKFAEFVIDESLPVSRRKKIRPQHAHA